MPTDFSDEAINRMSDKIPKVLRRAKLKLFPLPPLLPVADE